MTKRRLLEDKLINNSSNTNLLVSETYFLYIELKKNYYTTSKENIKDTYNIKEKYLLKYKLTLPELYYNIGILGIKIEKALKSENLLKNEKKTN